MKITRRDMLRLGLGASALAFAPIRLFAEGVCPKSIPIALQLYSIRGIAGNDLAKTFETVAGLGYVGVEFAGTFGKDAKTLRGLLDDAGLKCCGTHIGMGDFEGDNLKRNIEYYQTLGTCFMTISGMGVDRTVEAWKKRAEWFNEKSALCQKDGMFMGFHAHGGEFNHHNFDGLTGWEILFKNTDDAVTHQMDTGNCMGGGDDPVKFIRMFPGRTRHIHLKEHGGGDIVGKGDCPWDDVFKAVGEVGGTQWYIIESESRPDDYTLVDASIKGLKEMLAKY